LKSADVTDAVADDLANHRTRSQFRLRFTLETNLNGEGNQVLLAEIVPTSPDQPLLIVTYRR